LTREEVRAWFAKRVQRTPEAYDYYGVAKNFYQIGAFSRAILCLQEYVETTGATSAGRHLLAYSLLNTGQKTRALQEFRRCAQDGSPDDWQLVVELTIELAAETNP
ncbi:hypothetical protein CXG81DRAFT_12893, partial [Caulochytrium protostelioides]